MKKTDYTDNKQQQVIKSIEQYITDSRLLPGDRLPSERRLIEKHGFSRVTVRIALKALEDKGVVQRIHGKGTFVKSSLSWKKSISLVYAEKSWQNPGVRQYDPGNSFLLEGFMDADKTDPISVTLCYLHPDHQSIKKSLEILLSNGPDGFLFTSLGGYGKIIESLVKNGKVCVSRNYRDQGHGSYCLWADLRAGFYQAALDLLRQGRKKTAYLSDYDDNVYNDLKIEALTNAIKATGSKTGLEIIKPRGNYDFDAYKAVRGYFSRNPKTDLLACSTDHKAFGAMEAIKDEGLKIPDDVAIFGSDNLPECEIQNPPLASVEYPYHQMGKKIHELFAQAFRDPSQKPYSICYPCRFIHRASC